MSARETIKAALMKATHKPFGTAAVYEALTTKGYRILAPGELDPVTIERCAQQVSKAKASSGFTVLPHDIAAAIRSLSPTEGTAND